MKIRIALIFLILIGSSRIFAQNDNSDCGYMNGERVLVQLPNEYVMAGNRLSYAVRLFNISNAPFHKYSRIVYFSLVNTSNQVVHTWKKYMNQHTEFVSTQIPDTLKPGQYNLWAYTNWMRNDIERLATPTTLFIAPYGYIKTPDAALPCFGRNEIELFPEGESFIEGLKSRIIVSVPQHLFQSDLSGVVVDNKGDTTTTIHFDNTPAAWFYITPQPGEIYTAVIRAGYNYFRINLPPPQKSGCVLHARTNSQKELVITVAGVLQELNNNNNVTIEIFSKAKKWFSKNITLTEKSSTLQIYDYEVVKGLSKIVIKKNNTILARRFIYYNEKKDVLAVKTDKNVYLSRKKACLYINPLDISTEDTLNISVSIVKKMKNKMPGLSNQNNWHPVFSEIKLSNPSCFPQYNTDNRLINLLLVTADSDSYIWDIERENLPVSNTYFPFEENGFILSGVIRDEINKIPLKNHTVLLAVKDTVSMLDYSVTNTDGSFFFTLDKSFCNKFLVLQDYDFETGTFNHSNLQWTFDRKNITLQQPDTFILGLSKNLENQIITFCRKALINKIYDEIKHKEIELIQNRLNRCANIFYHTPESTVIPADYSELKDFKEIVNNILPLVKYKNKKGEFSLVLYNDLINSYYNKNAFLLLNGIPFGDFRHIDKLGTRHIKRIDISYSKILYGNFTFPGIIAIYTHDDKLPDEYLSYLKIYRNTGYSSRKAKCYAVTENDVNIKRFPIMGNVIYWKRDMQIVAGKTQELEFYTPDISGEYEIKINGVINNKHPVSYTTDFIVTRQNNTK